MTRLDAPWLTSDPTRRVIEALEAVRPQCVRFVGGCVRNTLMGRAVDDIDLATQLEPLEVLSALEAANIRAVPTGLEHGTVTAIVEHQPFEITSLRRDMATDGRRAVVAFTQDWEADARRRDFRLNALYASLDGDVFDPIGQGLEDALAGRVIFIGEAEERIKEDYLRILRFFRFNAWYGAAIDAGGLEACRQGSAGLAQIARERIWMEVKKLLAAPNPLGALDAMQGAGILGLVLPGAELKPALRELIAAEIAYGLAPDPLQRLMALIAPSEDGCAKLSERLRLSKAEAGRLMAWASLPADADFASPASLRALAYRHGAEAVRDGFLVRGVEGATGKLSQAELGAALAFLKVWEKPQFPLSGEDALKAGLEGAAIGAALKVAEAAWIESDFSLSKDALSAALSAKA